MKIQIGNVNLDLVKNQSILSNRSRKYLLPCLKEYGDDLVKKLENVYKVAVGLGDIAIFKRYYKAPERHLFILIDTKVASKHFKDLIEWIVDKEYYEDDYVYGNIQKSTHHMIVIKFPKKYWGSFDTFKEGKYSEMFNIDTIDKFYKKTNEVPKVLIRDSNYKIIFTKRLNKEFGSTIKAEEWEGELELPISYKFNEEIFE